MNDPMIDYIDELDAEQWDMRAEDREQEDPGSTEWYPDWEGPDA